MGRLNDADRSTPIRRMRPPCATVWGRAAQHGPPRVRRFLMCGETGAMLGRKEYQWAMTTREKKGACQ